jgi:hypothetical protein
VSKRTLERLAVYAVVRYDHFLADDTSPETKVTVKEVLPSREEAEREVARLNLLNKGRGSNYFWQYTRFLPKGRADATDQGTTGSMPASDSGLRPTGLIPRWTLGASEVAFIGALVGAHPWLLPILQEHIDDNDGVLPHLLLADVERWAEAQIEANGADDDRLRALLGYLEDAFGSGDAEVDELIAVSFLELLPKGGAGSELRNLVGSRLRDQLRIIG